jgi:predicted permease
VKDFRHAARLLTRTPGFTLLVSGLLALGIGASTIVFSFFEAVLLKPLHVHRPQELVRIVQRLPRLGPISSFPDAYYEALRDHATTLAFTFGEAGQYYHFAMTVPTPPEDISVRGITPKFFDALGVQPLYGRVLVADDGERLPETPPALLSHRLWRRRFGADPGAVRGTTIVVNGRAVAVVGVMPEEFNGLTTDTGPDLWIPLNAYRTFVKPDDDRITFELAGRLKPGFSRLQAEAECRSIWQSTMKDYYKNVEHRSEEDAAQLVMRGIELESVERGVSILRDSFDGVLKISITSTILLLLIVCLNVGGILLVRAAARQQEFAVRLALGASSLMLVRQILAESLLLAVGGGTGGVLLAVAVMPFARQALPPIRDRSGSLLPLTLAVSIDRQVVLFVVVVSLLAMLCFTASPVIAVCRSSLDSLLRSARSTARRRGRDPLIMVQVALCTLLLLIASLFVRSLRQLQNVDTGFDINHIATFTGDLSSHAGADASAFLTTLGERVREIPGVLSASVSSVAVMRGRGVSWTVAPAGERMTSAHFLDASGNTVSADYFETMGMRIARGRGFTLRDDAKARLAESRPTVVNQAFVLKFFTSVDPIGKHFGTPVNGVAGSQYEIVGVLNDAKYRSLREPIPPMFYTLGIPSDSFVMNVRASMRPDAIIEPVRKALTAVDPALPFREVHVMSEEVENSIASERLTAVVASSIGACAALFAGAGIYGSLAYIATLRRREIAIRMALGAGRIHTAGLIARQTLAMVAAGMIVGLGAASVAASGIRSMLFNISPHDAQSVASAIVFVTVMATAATAVPVMRAISNEPAEALRYEH